MKKSIAAILATFVLSSSAFAQVSTIESDNGGPRGPNPNKVVCEELSRTGSRLDTRKVCKTVFEWEQLRRDHREGVEAIQRQGTSVGCQEGQGCGG